MLPEIIINIKIDDNQKMVTGDALITFREPKGDKRVKLSGKRTVTG